MQIPALGLLFASLAFGQGVSVLTSQYDIARTGANPAESVITQANVSGLQVLGSYAVDGYVYAQPLIVSGVSIGGATRVMVTVTMHNSIYAFDANRPGTNYLWKRNVGTPLTSHPNMVDNFLYQGEVGCMATPVIDATAGKIFVLCAASDGNWWVYKLNLQDGTDSTDAVMVEGASNGITFNPIRHLFRSALGIVGHNLHIASTGWGDESPFQGWIFTFNTTSMSAVTSLSVEDALIGLGGFWSSGGGLASDGTSLFAISGNGAYNGTTNFSDSLLSISNLNLSIQDWATPANQSTIATADHDIAAGPLHYIAPGYVVVAGKDGRLMLADVSNMGRQTGDDSGFRQIFAAQNGPVFGCSVFAMNRLYLGANSTTLKAFNWNSSTHLFATIASNVGSGPYSSPGPGCSFSWDGSNTNTGLLWGVTPASGAFSAIQDGTLRAWEGSGMTEVFNSGVIGKYAKFAIPTVANGSVFVPTFSNSIVVLGFPAPHSISITGKVTIGGKVTIQ